MVISELEMVWWRGVVCFNGSSYGEFANWHRWGL